MAGTKALHGYVVSLKRGIEITDVVGASGEDFEAFLKRQPYIAVLEVLPTKRRAIIEAPESMIDLLRYNWGHKLHIYARGRGTTQV